MFDFNFNWDDSLTLGIEKLDMQHRELFKIGRDIEQLLLIQCIGVNISVSSRWSLPSGIEIMNLDPFLSVLF